MASSISNSLSSTAITYFLAGALLPSLWLFLRTTSSNKKGGSASLGDNDSGTRKIFGSESEEYDDDDDDDDSTEGMTASSGPSSKWGYRDGPYKMVLCVNQELGMGKGKIAAQCCHAAVGCYKRAMKQCPNAVRAWETTGCAKIALKCPTQDALELIAAQAMERDIPVYLIEDAGRTQIAAGSRTVLGIGPAPVSVFEGVSSHLKLM
jgi:PTH2 family peptidyl-tRNA hydrolase